MTGKTLTTEDGQIPLTTSLSQCQVKTRLINTHFVFRKLLRISLLHFQSLLSNKIS